MKKEIDPKKIKILVCCHKPCVLPKDEIFLPIQVGAAISNVDLGMQRDDKVNGEPCDNISAKNKNYCELTAMYWAWKNIKKIYPELEYIGLNHYRRYFFMEKKTFVKDLFIRPENEVGEYVLRRDSFKNNLVLDKTIIAKKRIYPYSLAVDYSICHISEDLRTLQNVIKDLYPDYINAFTSVLMHNNALAHYNMMIIGWEDFDSYCEWLFSILTEVEKRINIEHYSDVQKRIFGYMGERLFNVYLKKNKKEIEEVPVLQYVDNVKEYSEMYCLYRKIRYSLSMKILTTWRKK